MRGPEEHHDADRTGGAPEPPEIARGDHMPRRPDQHSHRAPRFEDHASVDIQFGQAQAALRAVAGRTDELLRSAEDGSKRAEGLEWTVGEVGAHLAITLRGFTHAMRGEDDVVAPHVPDIDSFPERVAAFTSRTLLLEPERDPTALADVIARGVEAFLLQATGRSGDEPVPTPWYGEGVVLSLATVTCLLLGEQLVHGYDIAKTINRPWPIAEDHARLVIRGVTSMMPLMVNPEAVAGVDASYGVNVRGGPRFVVRVHDRKVEIEPSESRPVDCHISADPVSLVLLAFGRKSQWWPIVTGKLVAWSRRPWLAVKFNSFFFNP